jgi:hypothetical protein
MSYNASAVNFYNASAVNFYSAASSLARSENETKLFYLINGVVNFSTAGLVT